MNTKIIDFLRNVSDENMLEEKENINAALSLKVGEAISNREQEIRTSLYNSNAIENKEN